MRKNGWKILAGAVSLALICPQMAAAEPSEVLKGIYEALLSEDSDYGELKALYKEIFPDTVFEETLSDDGITLSVSGDEYMEGSWTFTQEGEELTASFPAEDYSGLMFTMYLLDGVADYFGMNPDLVSGYVNGLGTIGKESESFSIREEEDGSSHVRISIAGPWEMKELEEMVLEGDALPDAPLGEDFNSMAANCGKLMMLANGSAEDLTILLREYGEFDDLALQSLHNIVTTLQPKGWEAFEESYAALADAEGEGYSVRLNVGEEEVHAFMEEMELEEDFSYALIHFGA